MVVLNYCSLRHVVDHEQIRAQVSSGGQAWAGPGLQRRLASFVCSAGGGDRTHTTLAGHRILSIAGGRETGADPMILRLFFPVLLGRVGLIWVRAGPG